MNRNIEMNRDDAAFHADSLRRWAKGMYNLEAAAELLLRGFGGRFAAPGNPWIIFEDGRPWIDFGAIPENVGALSGGERRYLTIAASLGDGAPVALSDAVYVDRPHLQLILAAIAHAGGVPALHPWQ